MTTAITTIAARTITTEVGSMPSSMLVFMSSNVTLMSPMSVLIVAMSP